MEQTLAAPVRVATHEHHRHGGDEVRHGRDQAHPEIAQPGEIPHDLRQPEAQDVAPERLAEEDEEPELPHGAARERLEHAQRGIATMKAEIARARSAAGNHRHR